MMVTEEGSFQTRTREWIVACFNQDFLDKFGRKQTPAQFADDLDERVERFVEEALELAQCLNCSEERVDRIKRYVYDRPAGIPAQEIGGVATTLAGLGESVGLHVDTCREIELARCWRNMDEIREKSLAKPRAKQQASAARRVADCSCEESQKQYERGMACWEALAAAHKKPDPIATLMLLGVVAYVVFLVVTVVVGTR